MSGFVVIREAAWEDLPAVAIAEESIYSLEGPWSLEDYQDVFTEEAACFLIAENRPGAELVGYGLAVIEDGVVEVQAVTTLPAFRGLGSGRAILRALLAWASAAGVPTVSLHVRENNAEAVNLYLSEGFTVVEEIEDFYDDGVHALRMERP